MEFIIENAAVIMYALIVGGLVSLAFVQNIASKGFVSCGVWNAMRCARCGYSFQDLGDVPRCPECGLTPADLVAVPPSPRERLVLRRVHVAVGLAVVGPMLVWRAQVGVALVADVLLGASLATLSWVVSRTYLRGRRLGVTLRVRAVPVVGFVALGVLSQARVRHTVVASGSHLYDGGAIAFLALPWACLSGPAMLGVIGLQHAFGDDGRRRRPLAAPPLLAPPEPAQTS